MGKRLLGSFAAIALIAVSSVANAATVLTGDTWNVTGTDTAGISWDGSTLMFTSQTATGGGDFDIEGYFDWVGSGGQSGRELFSGMYFADDTLDFSGFQLVSPAGIVLANYEGTVSADGDTIIGDWDGIGIPGDFTATRAVAAVPLPAGLPLMLSGLLGIGFLARRKKTA